MVAFFIPLISISERTHCNKRWLMSDPISGTGLAGGALTGASIYGLLTGTDYGVVFGAFAGAVSLPDESG